jgi:methylenetetrahydrofolate dehydrogenase (NADP+)/methenyltetrahydrofolate cyclohydrolase
MRLVEGRSLAAEIRRTIGQEAGRLRAEGAPPALAALIATDDPATAWYHDAIARATADVGIDFRTVRVEPADARGVIDRLDELSADSQIHGIICLTPLPPGLTLARAGERIAPRKDVDGANPTSLGRLAVGLPAFAPATAQAVMELLPAARARLVGADAVVVGRSDVVGKPAALMLLREHATVTICHSRTENLASITSRADVLVAAAGRPGLIGAEHVKPGAVVIDVGTNAAEDGSIVGDVDFDAVAGIAGAITPVPGGVGPVTTAVLLRNVVAATAIARRR